MEKKKKFDFNYLSKFIVNTNILNENFDSFSKKLDNIINPTLNLNYDTDRLSEINQEIIKKLFENEIDFKKIHSIYNKAFSIKYDEFIILIRVMLYTIDSLDLKIKFENIINDRVLFLYVDDTENSNKFNEIFDKNNINPFNYFILFLFYIFTFCGKIKKMNNLHEYLMLLELYSKVFISNITLFLLIHFSMFLFSGIVDKNSVNLISSCYLFDDIIQNDLSNEAFKQIIFTFNCKNFLYTYMKYQGFEFNINIVFQDIIDKDIKNNFLTECKKILFTEKDIIQISENEIVTDRKLINDMVIYLKNNILNYDFKSFLKNKEHILLKAKNILIKDIGKYNSVVEHLKNELEILNHLIVVMGKIYTNKYKKKEKFSFSISLRFFKISLNENIKFDTKAPPINIKIKLELDTLSHQDLLKNISQVSLYSNIFVTIIQLIKNFRVFKKYNLIITIDNLVEFEEIQHYLDILNLSIYNYCEFKGYKITMPNHSQRINNKFTLVVNNLIKEKEKKNFFITYLKKLQNAAFQAFLKYQNQFLDYVQEFIIDDRINNLNSPFNVKKLLTSFSNNKIYIYNQDNGFLNFNIYIDNEIFLEQIIAFISNLDNENNFLPIKDFVFIFRKSFFRNYFLKNDITQILNYKIYIVNDLEYIHKNTIDDYEEDINYDIFILDKRLCLINLNINEVSFAEHVFNFLKIYSFAYKIINKVILSKKKYFSHICYVYKNYYFDIYENGIHLKYFLIKDLSLFNNEKLFSSKYIIPVFSIIFKYGDVLDTKKVHFHLTDFSEIFINQNIIIDLNNEMNLKKSYVFKPFNQSIFINEFIHFIEDTILRNDLLAIIFSLDNLYKLCEFFKECSFKKKIDINLYIFNNDESENNLIDIYSKLIRYKFITDLKIYETILCNLNNMNDIHEDVHNYIPFKNSEIYKTIESISSTYRYKNKKDSSHNLQQVEILYKIIKHRKSILSKLRKEKILINFFQYFISEFKILHYISDSRLIDNITSDILELKKIKFKEMSQLINEQTHKINNIEEDISELKEAQEKILPSQYSQITNKEKKKKCIIY